MRFHGLVIVSCLGTPVLGNCADTRCGPSNCATCCDENDRCVLAADDAACGAGGGTCADCRSGGACDPSLGICVFFPGTYVVNGTVNREGVLGTTSTSFSAGVAVVMGSPASYLLVDVPSGSAANCRLTASITGSTTFTLGGTCPAFPTQLGCEEEWVYTQGDGSLTGNTLSVTLSGDYAQTGCPGVLAASGALSVTYSGSR